jgi:hypothetical protein
MTRPIAAIYGNLRPTPLIPCQCGEPSLQPDRISIVDWNRANGYQVGQCRTHLEGAILRGEIERRAL